MVMQRQGDVLVIHGVTIPKWAKRIEGKVVAKGELTGHNHEVEEGVLYEEGGWPESYIFILYAWECNTRRFCGFLCVRSNYYQ